MSFEKIIEEIKKQKKFALEDLTDVPRLMLNSKKSRKEVAKLRLSDLFFDYRKHMNNRLLAIVVAGSRANEFQAAVDQTEAKMPSFDGDSLYAFLASKLDSRMLQRGENANYVLDVVSRLLEDTASEIGIGSYNQMIYKNKYPAKIKSAQEAQDFIKEVMREQVGPEMNTFFLLDKAARLAFEEEFEGKFYPVMIKASDEQNLKDLYSSLSSLGNRVIVVSTDEGLAKDLNPILAEEITEKSVMSVLKKVKQKASKGQ